MKSTLARELLALATLALGACATTQPVQPWQKGKIALESMRMDAYPLERDYARQVVESKEGARGGDSVGGGGCGCN